MWEKARQERELKREKRARDERKRTTKGRAQRKSERKRGESTNETTTIWDVGKSKISGQFGEGTKEESANRNKRKWAKREKEERVIREGRRRTKREAREKVFLNTSYIYGWDEILKGGL